jgi:TRAP-type transport system periplasmic protein
MAAPGREPFPQGGVPVKKLALAIALGLAAQAAAAQEVVLKLGTLAPQGSTWHNLLKEMGDRWAEASGGKVKLRIYAGGTQGSEGDMVRKMGVGQLQAAAITNVGMHDVAKEPQALSAPMVIEKEAEFRAIFPKIEPRLDTLLEAKGYVALSWSEVGFVRMFCNKGYQTPAEMTDAKVAAWDGDPASVQAFRAAGLRPVVISSTDLVPSLQTGMVTCVANVPLYMLTTRMFEKANHMMDMPWGYLVGGTLVRKDAWEKVPADVRPKLLAIARELGARVDAEVRKLNEDAIAAMQRQGLTVQPVDQAAWRAAGEKTWSAVRGGVAPADFFDEVIRLRDAYRKGPK